jgi:hypothetical protein
VLDADFSDFSGHLFQKEFWMRAAKANSQIASSIGVEHRASIAVALVAFIRLMLQHPSTHFQLPIISIALVDTTAIDLRNWNASPNLQP